MQTTVFYEHLYQIQKGLNLENLQKLVSEILANPHTSIEPYKKVLPELVFGANAELQNLLKDPEKQLILVGLGITQIFSTQRLTSLLTALQASEQTSQIIANTTYYRIFSDFAMSLIFISKLTTTVNSLLIAPASKTLSEGEELLDFEIIDYANVGIDFDRFQTVLKSIYELHDAISRTLGLEAKLSIASLDSGSNSLITIKSDGKIVRELRLLIKDIWDRVRFGKTEKLKNAFETGNDGLAFLDLIHQKEQAGIITPDEANRLRHKVICETEKLFENGTTLREIQKDDTIPNKKLLSDFREVKLLNSSNAGAVVVVAPVEVPTVRAS